MYMKLVTAIAVACMAGPAMADGPRVYAYETAINYCPAGLQPVTLDGTISCGTPNQAQTYQQAKRHPGAQRIRSAVPRYGACATGVKGCD